MVRISRISTTPATALDIQINAEDVSSSGFRATPATDDGPTFSATVDDATAAALQEDAGLAQHFSFEPITPIAAIEEAPAAAPTRSRRRGNG